MLGDFLFYLETKWALFRVVKNPHSSLTNAGWTGSGGMKGNGGWKCVIWKKPHAKAGKKQR